MSGSNKRFPVTRMRGCRRIVYGVVHIPVRWKLRLFFGIFVDQPLAETAGVTIRWLIDGRTLTAKKVKTNGLTYPQVIMTALQGAKVNISYDANDETFSAEPPFKYEVKDFSNNNAYFKLTVDEGGPAKTWSVKLQHTNGYDLKID